MKKMNINLMKSYIIYLQTKRRKKILNFKKDFIFRIPYLVFLLIE